MEALDLARWQFGITTVYHFLFVPLTIGLSFIVASLQTAWVARGNERYLRLTHFYGDIFLVIFALGVATGIVQEFQFGMNWSEYSRFVGDIFGAPLAIEGLLAFFLESTFLGIWIFGWDRLPRKVHLASIWIAAIGTLLSAYFILAANSWMQNPVGYTYNPVADRAELTDFVAVLTNPVAVDAFLHTIAACFVTAGSLVAGIALWRVVRRPDDHAEAFRFGARLGAVTVVIAFAIVFITGDQQGKLMTTLQPMKVAASEALYQTEQPAAFSIFTLTSLDGRQEIFSIRVPNLLSWLATGDLNGRVEGMNDLQAQYEAQYGPGDYIPSVLLSYWSFRLMMVAGGLAALACLWALWRLRRGGLPGRWLVVAGLSLPFLPLLANSFGWILTEAGRQPWIVFGVMQTAAGVSPTSSWWEVLLTVVGFTLLYGARAVVALVLVARRVRAATTAGGASDETADAPFTFAY
jgi:cytochrome d ubiquinol oxidase subunit I